MNSETAKEKVALPKIKDIAAARKKSAPKERKNPLARVGNYLKEVRTEFKKVMWPNRAEIAAATVVVLTTLLFFALYIGLFDFGFSKIVELILP